MLAMEACILTCKSFTPTRESFPSIKPKSFSFHSKNFPQFLCKNVDGSRSLRAMCQLPSTSPDDDREPMTDKDWRSFRARLVAGEQASRPSDPTSGTDANPGTDDPPRVILAQRWVHPLHEPEAGCLLVATTKLDGVHIFERTVILVLSMGPLGPSGIIINRPSLMSIKETGSTVMDVAGTFSDRPLYFGGPLEEGLILVSSQGEDEVRKSGVFEEVIKGLYYGTKESVGCAAEMVKRKMVDVEDFRFFDGYCGWDRKQLKEEIRAGYWSVAACSPGVIGLGSVGSVGLWEEVLGLMGGRKVW